MLQVQGGAAMQIVYYVVATGLSWRVQSRGFAWNFPTRQDATEFAMAMAEQFAAASGRSTCVRRQENGNFEELQVFGPTASAPARPGRVVHAPRRMSGLA
jgi:hypothetical protein